MSRDREFEYNIDDPRPYQEQYDDWLLCSDTIECNISNYPGRGEEMKASRQFTKVITKRSRKHE